MLWSHPKQQQQSRNLSTLLNRFFWFSFISCYTPRAISALEMDTAYPWNMNGVVVVAPQKGEVLLIIMIPSLLFDFPVSSEISIISLNYTPPPLMRFLRRPWTNQQENDGAATHKHTIRRFSKRYSLETHLCSKLLNAKKGSFVRSVPLEIGWIFAQTLAINFGNNKLFSL